MLKICGISICKPLEIIFRTCLNHGNLGRNGKRPMSLRYLKKATSNVLKSIALYPCYQFLVRYLEELYIIINAITLSITI